MRRRVSDNSAGSRSASQRVSSGSSGNGGEERLTEAEAAADATSANATTADNSPEKIRELFREVNTKFYERYTRIDNSDDFFMSMYKPIRSSIRVNTLKADLEDVVARLREDFHLESVPWCEEGFFINTESFGSIPEHRLGVIFTQESASMIPPVLMELSPKMNVLDIAAAPGAKTTQIAQYMCNDGCIIANDVKMKRLNILISNLQRCGVLIAHVTMKDGRFFGKFEERFDAVLVDVPCSNVGMIRKNFKYLKYWRASEIKRLSKLQKGLILAGYKALKGGGVLIYSTCTLDPVENEAVVDFLIRETEAEIEDIKLPVNRHPPFLEFDGVSFNEDLRKCLRIHPQDNDTEGFFVAKIRKP